MRIDRTYLYTLFDELHGMPEPGFQEVKTAERLAQELKTYGYQVTEHADGTTAVLGVRKGKSEGKTLTLRADMDALSYEVNGQIQYRHTCGHDAHSAMVMTAARYFGQHPEEIEAGTLQILFQPAEETTEGSLSVIKSGILESTDELAGLHIRPKEELSAGMASSAVFHGACGTAVVEVQGKSAHGARPQQGINAIEAGITLAEQVGRIHLDPQVSHSAKLTRFISGGKSLNVIPDRAELGFDFRAQNNEQMQHLVQQFHQMADAVAAAFGARISILKETLVPAAEFDEELTQTLHASIEEVLGKGADQGPVRSPGGEDFHRYRQAYPNMKTAFLGVGAEAYPGLHAPDMQFRREALEEGAEILTAFVRRRMKE